MIAPAEPTWINVANKSSSPRTDAIIPPKNEPAVPMIAVFPQVIGLGPGIKSLAIAPITRPTIAN